MLWLAGQIGWHEDDSARIARIDESVAVIVERYEAEIGGRDERIVELEQALVAVRGAGVDGGQDLGTVEDALATFERDGDPAKADAILAEVEQRATGAAAPHLAEAAQAARQRGALAYGTDALGALDHYRRAAALDPDHFWTWIFISRLEVAAGRLDAAEEAAQRALALARAQAAVRDEMVAQNTIGDVRVLQGDLDGALAAFEAGKTVAERLAAADSANNVWQHDLSVSWDRLGNVRVAQGDLGGALAAFEASKAIFERLAAADPAHSGWQRDLSVSWEKLGDVRVAQGDLGGALAAFEASKAIRERSGGGGPGAIAGGSAISR